MKKLVKIATATTLGLGLSVSAMASENIQTTSNSAVQPSADLSYAFDDSEDLQVKAISNQEMEKTEGAWVPQAIGGIAGGLGGHYGYMGQSAFTGQYNFRSHLVSIGLGSAGGIISPAVGLNSAAGAFGLGVAGGAANAWATNTGTTRSF